MSNSMQRPSTTSVAFAILVALWLLCMIFPPVIGTQDLEILQLISLIWLFPIAFLAGREYFVYAPTYRRESAIRLWAFLFLLTASLSALLSEYPSLSLAKVMATTIGLVYCAGLWFCLKDKVRLCLSLYAVLGSVLLGYVYITTPLHRGRLSWTPSSQPNHLAVIAYGILIAALAIRSRWISWLLILVNLLVIMATQGRGSLIASLITLGSYGALREMNAKNRRGLLKVAAFTILALAAGLAYQEHISELIEQTLLLHDPNRGLDSGFTGRVDSWRDAYGLFVKNPVLGVGYRLHGLYGSASSGYLALLAEVGIIGIICAMVLTLVATIRLLRIALAGNQMAILGISAVLGYLFLAFFEGLFINTGLPTSMLVWLFLLMPYRERRAGFACQAKANPDWGRVRLADSVAN